jgi:hypothetical protein
MWQNQLHNHSTLVQATNTNTIHRPTSTAHGVFKTDISSYTIEKEPSPNTILIILAWSWVLFKFKNMNNDNENHQKTPRMLRQTYLVGRTNHGTRRRWHAHTRENKSDPSHTCFYPRNKNNQQTRMHSQKTLCYNKMCQQFCTFSFTHWFPLLQFPPNLLTLKSLKSLELTSNMKKAAARVHKLNKAWYNV